MDTKRIILAGGTGFLGQALARHLANMGWDPVILARNCNPSLSPIQPIAWDGKTAGPWSECIDGAAAVVNLTGRSVNCRYTSANRTSIMDSRVIPTRLLGEVIVRCKQPPAVWLNASSATLYRHTFDQPWDESGTDFTPEPAVGDAFSIAVIRAWEHALFDTPLRCTRRIALRTSMVLGNARNSVVPVLRRLARCGLGGRMGSGNQYVSWIHIDDFCHAILWLINHQEINGAVNLTSPCPLTNSLMMRHFRELAGMPIGLPASKWMLEIGAMFLRTETELILKSRRVVPGRLLASGYRFQHPEFREALLHLNHQLP